METIDLSQYREDGSIEWYYEELERIGEERMYKLREFLFNRAKQMKIGSSINVLDLCTDRKNLRLIVKTLCEIIISTQNNPLSREYYEFKDGSFTVFRKGAITWCMS